MRIPSETACCEPLDGPALPGDDAERLAARCKALADPHRVRIVHLLAAADAPVCVCDLTPPLGLAQPTVSHHLRVLREAGLVHRERRGTWAYYHVDRAALADLASALTPREEPA